VKTQNGVVPGDYTMLAVSDNGIGMNAEIQSHLFEPFFTTKEKDKGTGLGLATCYGIVKQNNGGIWIYSEAGRGTTVKVYLPRAKGSPETVIETDTLSGLSGGSETILIVEDEHAVRDMIVKVLKSKGYTIVGASNGEEALRLYERHENGVIDMLITDVVMPHMGGIELVERLFAKYGPLKVLYMSGYTDTTIVNHGILKPGVEFLQKPFTPGSLIQKVRQVLDK
jgi:CheY-like chemotaxis protein